LAQNSFTVLIMPACIILLLITAFYFYFLKMTVILQSINLSRYVYIMCKVFWLLHWKYWFNFMELSQFETSYLTTFSILSASYLLLEKCRVYAIASFRHVAQNWCLWIGICTVVYWVVGVFFPGSSCILRTLPVTWLLLTLQLLWKNLLPMILVSYL